MITGILWIDMLIAIGGVLAINAIGGYIVCKWEEHQNERRMILNNIGNAMARIDRIERTLVNVVKANAEPFNKEAV